MLQTGLKLAVDIHSLVQNSNRIERACCFLKGQVVRVRGVLLITMAHETDSTECVAASQGLHRCYQIVVVLVRLLERAVLKRIAPNILEIRFSQRREPAHRLLNRRRFAIFFMERLFDRS